MNCRVRFMVVGAMMGGAALGNCGTPNPRILESTEQARGMPSTQLGQELSEPDKIAALIEQVRRSEHTFVHDDIERNGKATANKLQLLLERDPNGVRSAREFIERIAAPPRTDEPADRVIVSEEESVLASQWYVLQLAKLENRPSAAATPEEQRQAQAHARRLAILSALRFVEQSGLTFIAPVRKSNHLPTRGRKPKAKRYSGKQFADMLRTKWEYLGADINDFESFVDEIATESFSTMVRYRVVFNDEHTEDFAGWLTREFDPPYAELAQGG